MNSTELKDLIATMKEMGVVSLKTEGIELVLDPSAFITAKPPLEQAVENGKARQTIENIKATFQMTDAELLDHLYPAKRAEEPTNEEV